MRTGLSSGDGGMDWKGALTYGEIQSKEAAWKTGTNFKTVIFDGLSELERS